MNEIRQLIDQGRISGTQISVIVLCVLMNMLDGMDVMVISYSAPSLSEEWGILPKTLGVVFSSALLGMTLGAAFLAPWADVIGRRTIIILCIIVMGGGVLLTAAAQEIWHLIVLRFLSGLGIGAMLASTVTLASEYAPERQRNFIVSIVLTGYPIGATLSGLVAAQIIPVYGWRTMFLCAGLATIICLPLALCMLSESWDWLIKKQPRDGLQKLNRILGSMGHVGLGRLPVASEQAKKAPGLGSLFNHGRVASTVKLWIAFFMGFATLYLLVTWIPNLARNAGMSMELAIYAGTVFNMGAIFGNLCQGYSSQVIGLRPAIVLFYVMTAILMITFGHLSGDWLKFAVFGLIGFGVQGGLIGLYTVAARIYATEMRNTGIGWAIGAGRTGAIVSPVIGGWLASRGVTPANSLLIFAFPLLIACMAIWSVREKD